MQYPVLVFSTHSGPHSHDSHGDPMKGRHFVSPLPITSKAGFEVEVSLMKGNPNIEPKILSCSLVGPLERYP